MSKELEISDWNKDRNSLMNYDLYNDSIVSIARFIIHRTSEEKATLICGNGGSASQCDHFAGELLGKFISNRFPIPVVNLASNIGAMTAIANDFSYDYVFSRQVEAYKKIAGCLIVISTSGNSRNILEAISMANKFDIPVILLTGKSCRESVLESVFKYIVVDTDITAIIQEVHEVILHNICLALEEFEGV